LEQLNDVMFIRHCSAFIMLQIVVFGGTSVDMATAQTPSSSSSYRINLGAATPTWETETMPYPRVMGDAVVLPDGTVFVANGGQIGESSFH